MVARGADSRCFSARGLTIAAGLLQEKVDYLKICLEIARTHEGKCRGVLLQGEPKRPSPFGLHEVKETATELLRRLIRQPHSILFSAAISGSWSAVTPDGHHLVAAVVNSGTTVPSVGRSARIETAMALIASSISGIDSKYNNFGSRIVVGRDDFCQGP